MPFSLSAPNQRRARTASGIRPLPQQGGGALRALSGVRVNSSLYRPHLTFLMRCPSKSRAEPDVTNRKWVRQSRRCRDAVSMGRVKKPSIRARNLRLTLTALASPISMHPGPLRRALAFFALRSKLASSESGLGHPPLAPAGRWLALRMRGS